MKNLKIYLLASALVSSISLTACKRVNGEVAYNFETTSISVSNKISMEPEIKTIRNKDILEEMKTDSIVVQNDCITKNSMESNENQDLVTISFTGDCTLGTYADSSNRAFEVLFENQQDYEYYFRNVKDIFENDDYTVINLEGPLTDALVHQDKPFAFKGRKEYINILLNGGVDSANLSNNHIMDYYNDGYNDTINILEENNIDYFDNTNFNIKIINGHKFGFAGFKAFNTYSKSEIEKSLKYFNDNDVEIKIITLHGGIEYEYQFDSIKEELAHYAIDNGADLVIGHHPHILQGIEEYNGKYILYSLGNFCYGGNRNPIDKNSLIAQVTFSFENDECVNSNLKLIPVSISSVEYENNFQPTVLDGEKKEFVLKLVNDYSKNFEYSE